MQKLNVRIITDEEHDDETLMELAAVVISAIRLMDPEAEIRFKKDGEEIEFKHELHVNA